MQVKKWFSSQGLFVCVRIVLEKVTGGHAVANQSSIMAKRLWRDPIESFF